MIPVSGRLKAFARLGETIDDFLENKPDKPEHKALKAAVAQSLNDNPWFNPENIRFSLQAIASMLREEALCKWIEAYPLETMQKPVKVAVIMAGNIPLVGFHDFLCVLMSGHRLKAKLSSDDKALLPAIAQALTQIDPRFEDRIAFENGQLTDFDAVIATGSNNTARYFDYYFQKYPHIVRRNRNSVAVLSGFETPDDFRGLADDIFMYFGLGCRNVTKVYLPDTLAPSDFIRLLPTLPHLMRHSKYANNYDYNKAVFLINRIPFYEGENFLLREDPSFASPVSVLHFEHYRDIALLKRQLQEAESGLQCVVAGENIFGRTVAFGQSQFPGLNDYADGVDVFDFLMKIG